MLDRKEITTRAAIRTRYHGPTDRRGSRISASWHKHRVYVPYAYDENSEQNHAGAAQVLLDKYFNGEDRLCPNVRCSVDLSSGLDFKGDLYWTFTSKEEN